MKIGEQVYSCSPNVAEKSFNDSAPRKPQLLTIQDVLKRPTGNFLVLVDGNGCTYYENENECVSDLTKAEEIYQKQKKIYGAGLLSDCINFVDEPELAQQLEQIREKLREIKND